MQNHFYGQSINKFSIMFSLLAVFSLSGCGDGGVAAGGTATATATGNAATLQLSASSTTVPSDNSASTTITVTALSASNAALPGIVVALSTDTGIVSASTVTTGADGTVTFTFRSGTASLANRTATITASAGATAQIAIQIAGATLSVFSSTGSSVTNDGNTSVVVTFIAKNAQGTGLANTPYTASWVTTSGGSQLGITPVSGNTDANGKFAITVTGAGTAPGTATLTATAAGSTASATINVTTVSATFGITQTSNSTGPVVTVNPTTVPMQIGDQLTVTVATPYTTNVVFTTTQGAWNGGTQTISVTPSAAGIASAVLTETSSGQANVQVNDVVNTSITDSLIVGITAVTPYQVLLTASPTVVPKSSGTTTGTSILVATVLDANNLPVGNAPVSFSLYNTTGGGENVSPVVVYTATLAGGSLGLGQASATFTSGTLSSSATGVQVRATVGTTGVVTNTAPSSVDASIVIGGTAGSIAIGMATTITTPNATSYQLPMSVLVSDSNGNPQVGQVVSLSLWPVAWSTGVNTPCAVDADNGSNQGTFYNEDMNQDLILDNVSPGVSEDGYRKYYVGGTVVTGGTVDGLITPVNSAAGSLPSSVTTDANGLASFNLTYLRSNAIWTTVRVRASTVVQGSATVSQNIFSLPALKADVSPVCYLYPPPYNF